MAHEGLAVFIVILGALLLIAYYFGPRNETRSIKRQEGMIMLIPSAALLFLLAAVIYSGILG